MNQKIFSKRNILSALIVILSVLCLGFGMNILFPNKANTNNIVESKVHATSIGGDFGKNDQLHWDFNQSTGKLTITNNTNNNVSMPRYTSDFARPCWESVIKREDVISVEIGSKITSIGYYVFQKYQSMENVQIGSNVTIIEDYAFYDCIKLTNIVIPNSVTNIGDNSFYSCTSLTSVTYSTSGNGYTFNNGTLTIANQNFPNSNVFEPEWYGLNPLILNVVWAGNGSNITIIPGYLFRNCHNLTSITIPNTVNTISSEAFMSCYKLTTVNYSKNETGYSFLNGTLTLDNAEINVSSSNPKWYNIRQLVLSVVWVGNGSNVTSIPRHAFYQCINLTSVTIPKNVITIGVESFYGCKRLTSVSFESNSQLSSISNYAFSYCSSLASIIIPKSVISLENNAFDYCNNLLNVNFESNSQLSNIGNSTFSRCESLTNITLPNNLSSIGDSSFYYCSSLTSITIPNNVTSIGNGAFSNCSSLQNITIPSSIDLTIANYFSSCENIQAVNYTKNGTYYSFINGTLTIDNIENIPNNPEWENLNSLILNVVWTGNGSNVKSIGNYAFYLCYNLGSITIPSGVKSIGNYAFQNCKKLTNLIIPKNVETIGNWAFSNCLELSTINFESGSKLTKISIRAFSGCPISTITIPSGVNDYNSTALTGCSLVSINVDNNNTYFKSVNGVLFDSNMTILYNYPSKKLQSSYSIPSGVNKIAEFAFESCNNLTNISIPNTVQRIEYYAFANCTGLTGTLTIPSSVANIGQNAFSDCRNLNITFAENSQLSYISSDTFYKCGIKGTLTIPNSVTSIGQNAFRCCAEITSVNLSQVNYIGNYAFSSCSNLETILFSGSNILSVGENVFNHCYGLSEVTIPNNLASVSNYMFNYCYNLSSIIFEDNSIVSTIGQLAFCQCKSLTSICISASVTSIQNDAFNGCKNLSSVTFENNSQLTSIGSNAFYECSLSTITIPKMVTSIGANAFWNTSHSLGTVNILSNTFFQPSVLPGIKQADQMTGSEGIYVPYSLYNTYRTNSSWTSWRSKIFIYVDVESDGLKYAITDNGAVVMGYNEDLSTEIDIPEQISAYGSTYNVTEIAQNALSNLSDVTTVTIPATITTIGYHAFSYLSSLRTLYFNATYCQDIGGYVFECSGDSTYGMDVYFGQGVQRIPEHLIGDDEEYQTYVNSIEIPSSVTEIADYAFACLSVKKLTIACNELQDYDIFITPNEYSFFDSLGNMNGIYVPYKLVNDYKSASGWIAYASKIYSMEYMQNGVLYSKYDSTTAYVSGYTNDLSSYPNVTILSSVTINGNDYTVTAIGSEAFSICSYITSLAFEDGSCVATIGEGAFEDCINLQSVTLGSGIETICWNLFNGCTSLASITIPSNVTYIEGYAFYGCSGLQTLTIGENVEFIEEQAFYGLVNLQTLYFNAIDCGIECDWTFGECGQNVAGGTEVIFGNSVESIPSNLFYCSDTEKYENVYPNITKVTIGESVTYIGASAFDDCFNLRKVNSDVDGECIIPDNVEFMDDCAFYDQEFTKIAIGKNVVTMYDCFGGTTKLEKFVYNSSVSNDDYDLDLYISDWSSESAGLEIVIGDDCVFVPADFAREISALKKVTIGNSVTYLDDTAFYGCTNLEKLIYNIATAQSDFEYYGDDIFENSGSSTKGLEVVIGDDCVYVPESFMQNNTTVKTITIGESVEDIGNCAFYGCINLEKLYFNAAECGDLDVNIFYEAGQILTNGFEMICGENVERIPDSLFYCNDVNDEYCAKLTKVTFGRGVLEIGESAFDDCYWLRKVNSVVDGKCIIPDTVETICDYAFSDCPFANIQIGINVKSIGNAVFGVDYTYISNEYTYIQSQLTKIRVNEDNEHFTSTDTDGSFVNAIISRGVDPTLVQGCSTTVIPDFVKVIAEHAFYGCNTLTSIVIPHGVTEIGDGAFDSCSSLKSISVPTTVTTVSTMAFYGCTALKEIWTGSSQSLGLSDNVIVNDESVESEWYEWNVNESGWSASKASDPTEIESLLSSNGKMHHFVNSANTAADSEVFVLKMMCLVEMQSEGAHEYVVDSTEGENQNKVAYKVCVKGCPWGELPTSVDDEDFVIWYYDDVKFVGTEEIDVDLDPIDLIKDEYIAFGVVATYPNTGVKANIVVPIVVVAIVLVGGTLTYILIGRYSKTKKRMK